MKCAVPIFAITLYRLLILRVTNVPERQFFQAARDIFPFDNPYTSKFE